MPGRSEFLLLELKCVYFRGTRVSATRDYGVWGQLYGGRGQLCGADICWSCDVFATAAVAVEKPTQSWHYTSNLKLIFLKINFKRALSSHSTRAKDRSLSEWLCNKAWQIAAQSPSLSRVARDVILWLKLMFRDPKLTALPVNCQTMLCDKNVILLIINWLK